jgi:hypothetical protein
LLLAAALVVVLTGAVVTVATHSSAPFRAEEAGLTGDVWVMPEKDVVSFLRQRGIPDPNPNPEPSGSVVVGRVSWTPHHGKQGERFTILLGDQRGGAGVIRQVLGPREEDVSLGAGSMWNATTAAHSWLRNSGPVKTDGGSTSRGTFAAIPTAWSGDVWFLAQVVDVRGAGTTSSPDRIDSPAPVLAVALSTDDHVWWTRKVAVA